MLGQFGARSKAVLRGLGQFAEAIAAYAGWSIFTVLPIETASNIGGCPAPDGHNLEVITRPYGSGAG